MAEPASGRFARGELWVAAQVVLLAVHFGLALAFARLSWSVASVLGLTLLLAGLGLGVLALRQLGRNLTPNPRPLETAQLVTSGLYGAVRHPIYFSLIVASAGLSLAAQSEPSHVTELLLFVFFSLKADREERWLVERYADYPAYQRRVRKLIPWLY